MSHQCNQPACPGYRSPQPQESPAQALIELWTPTPVGASETVGGVPTPAGALKSAAEAATAAMDAAHAAGLSMPWASQVAGAIAVLDTASRMLAEQEK